MAPNLLLRPVIAAYDKLLAAAKPHGGLIPSLLDRESGTMLTDLPDPIKGQRNGDRAHLGVNLMHDQALLQTLYALSKCTGQSRFGDAADRYLTSFVDHCTDTVSGLFPWGEHSFWHLAEDRVGSSYDYHRPEDAPTRPIHDHLRQAPLWLWEKLWSIKPDCVKRFADGLDCHWKQVEPGRSDEYLRHAPIMDLDHPTYGNRACDFPRHSGFYIFDLAVAHTHCPTDAWRQQIVKFADYWWEKKDPLNLLLVESRSPEEQDRFYNVNAPGQTISLATSLLEAAELLAPVETELARQMRERATAYIDGFFAAPHDLENRVFVILSKRGSNERVEKMPTWGSVYGLWPASYIALTCLCAWRLTKDQRLLDWATAVGKAYAVEPFPIDVAVPAMDTGLGLGLLADLYDITGDADWLEQGRDLAARVMPLYFDKPIPSGAAGIDWYESQMGPAFLLHGLARLAMLDEDPNNCPLDPDYTTR